MADPATLPQLTFGDDETFTAKLCTRCRQVKALTLFYVDNSRPGNLTKWCRECHRSYSSSESVKARRRKRRRTERGRRAEHLNRIKRYGLTADDWDRILIQQSGRCAACTDPLAFPHIDHNHATGVVRGLLCSACNTSEGLLRTPESAGALAAYMRVHRADRDGA